MQNKGRKNLHKYLMQASSADDVTNSHAYGKVAKNHKSIPRRPPVTGHSNSTVAGYRDSMVGSSTQYRSLGPKKTDPVINKDTQNDTLVGNRPKSGTNDVPKGDAASIERRHHFIEPPKRGFNRFD